MTLKTVTSFHTLMRLAKEVGRAKISGDEAWILKAQKAHDEYKELCLESDEMTLNMTNGALIRALKGEL